MIPPGGTDRTDGIVQIIHPIEFEIPGKEGVNPYQGSREEAEMEGRKS
jgi:hypothetical protein